MVSLARHLESPGSGMFFDGTVNMDDEEYLQPVLVSQENESFQKLDTAIYAFIALFFGLALEITGIVFVSIWREEESKCNTYFIFLYLHCAFWLIVLVTVSVLKWKHHSIRLLGYLEFYQMNDHIIKMPLFIVSFWNAAFLLLAVFLQHTHKVDFEEYCGASELFTPINYILFLMTVELIVLIPIYVHYIRNVFTFNKAQIQPDVMREDWLTSFAQDSYAGSGEVGYRGSHKVMELLEKQADLIRYLREHNNKLSQQMMLLAAHRRATET